MAEKKKTLRYSPEFRECAVRLVGRSDFRFPVIVYTSNIKVLRRPVEAAMIDIDHSCNRGEGVAMRAITTNYPPKVCTCYEPTHRQTSLFQKISR